MLIGYARVSTTDQDLNLQVQALEKANCERIFTEKVSGQLEIRKELENVLAYMRPGDTLVVWKLSRLARSIKQIISLSEKLQSKQVNLKVLTQNIDTTTPEGRLFFHITAAFDEFQRELIIENTKAGLLVAKSRGNIGGRPKTLTPEKLSLAEAMIKDIKNYPSISKIIKSLDIGRTTFYRYFPPEKINQLRDNASFGTS